MRWIGTQKHYIGDKYIYSYPIACVNGRWDFRSGSNWQDYKKTVEESRTEFFGELDVPREQGFSEKHARPNLYLW